MSVETKEKAKNQVAKATSGNVALASNPWSKLAAELDRVLGAPILKFAKDGRFALSDTDQVPDGTRCLARVDLVQIGWVKWRDNVRVDVRMGAIAESFRPPKREELGDEDQSDWEKQPDESRRDPWQFNMVLPVTRLDTDETFNFTASSKGGLRAIGDLVKRYGSRLARNEGGLPIVELKADSYKHRTYGKIYFPRLVVTSWTEDGQRPSVEQDLADEIPF